MRGMEPETLERIPVSYRCSCSRERISAALRSCGAGELRSMAAGGEPIEVTCQFCDHVYSFAPQELLSLADMAQEEERQEGGGQG